MTRFTAEQIANAMRTQTTYREWRKHTDELRDERTGKYVPDELCSSHVTWDEIRNLCDRVL